MLSVCIPIYNFDVRPLITSLDKEIAQLSDYVELILIDDASSHYFREINEKECQKHQYIKLAKNIGRSRIRNLFLDYVSYENLLFLDCDSLIIKDNFIVNYIKRLQQSQDQVICGGRVYSLNKPEKKKWLRWKYGVKRESQKAEERRREPNRSFMTNNFVIKKGLLQEIKFDERLEYYGHEDTLFGFDLWKNNIQITHVENPIENGDIEDNEVFLYKTEEGVRNLALIYKYMNDDPQLANMVQLLKVYKKLHQYYLIGVVRWFFLILRKPLKKSLINGPISIKAFNFYKLGLFIGFRAELPIEFD